MLPSTYGCQVDQFQGTLKWKSFCVEAGTLQKTMRSPRMSTVSRVRNLHNPANAMLSKGAIWSQLIKISGRGVVNTGVSQDDCKLPSHPGPVTDSGQNQMFWPQDDLNERVRLLAKQRVLRQPGPHSLA